MPEVQPGSDLAIDATASPDWQVAHLAWGAWTSAVDNLDAFRQLVTVAKVIHPCAPYSLIRVATENAAVAAWLLSPDNSATRVTRRLHLAWQDTLDVAQVAQLGGPQILAGRRSIAERQAAIRDVAQSGTLDLTVICGRPSWSKIVNVAAGVTTLDADAVEMLWRLCSGFAHARDWARFAWLRIERLGETDPGVVNARLTTDVADAARVAIGAYELLQVAEELFDKRRLHWRSH